MPEASSKLTRHETVPLFLQISSHTDDKGQLDGDKDGRSGVSTLADLQLDDHLDYLKASYADTYAACSKALLRCLRHLNNVILCRHQQTPAIISCNSSTCRCQD